MLNYVAICTKERSTSLDLLLQSLADSKFLIEKIIIVDSSVKYCRPKNNSLQSEIVYLHEPQLNLIEARERTILTLNSFPTDSETVLHFIDDDCLLSKDYFIEIVKTFKFNQAIGVTGFNTRYSDWPSIVKWLVEKTKYFKMRQGQIFRFGFAIGCYEDLGVKEVQWLPGFSMSIRNNVLQNIMLDKKLSKFNCIAEDLDLSLQISLFGKLYVNTDAKLAHIPSPVNRNFKIYKKLYRQFGAALYIYKKYFFLTRIIK
jgi:hypothetical protein